MPVEQQRNGLFPGHPEEEILGKQVVIAPQEGEDGHRGKGGLGRRHDDVEVRLEHVAAAHVDALLQLNRHRLDKAHEHNRGKAQVAGNLGQDDRQQGQPAVSAAGDAPGGLHAEHQDDGGEHREHHPRHDEAVAHAPQAEAAVHQPIGRQPRQDHHHRRRDGYNQAVEVGVGKVEAVHGLGVVVHGEAAARQGNGKGVLADEPLFPEGIQDDPHEGVQGGQRWGDSVRATRPESLENTGFWVVQAFFGCVFVRTTC